MNLKFWKKDDLGLPDLNNSFGKAELGLKDNSGLDLSSHFEPGQSFTPSANMPPAPPAFSMQQPLTPTSFPPSQPAYQQEAGEHPVSKDLEIIAAKLDTIRAQLEMLNTRVANLEHQNQGPPKRPWY